MRISDIGFFLISDKLWSLSFSCHESTWGKWVKTPLILTFYLRWGRFTPERPTAGSHWMRDWEGHRAGLKKYFASVWNRKAIFRLCLRHCSFRSLPSSAEDKNAWLCVSVGRQDFDMITSLASVCWWKKRVRYCPAVRESVTDGSGARAYGEWVTWPRY
jgi:hypothetical protein